MSGIFSALSGHLTRSLVLGTFLPVVVFLAGAFLFVVPLLPPSWSAPGLPRAADDWTIWLFVLVALALTGLLHNLNTPLVRWYEGYPWKNSRLGSRRSRRYEARVRRAEAAKGRLILARRVLRDDRHSTVLEDVQEELNNVSRELGAEFPGRNLVLPTRLGNVIRSFEEYSRQQYGMSAVPLWPRLVSHIPKEYAAIVDDAKTAMDFALNSSFLCSVLAAAVVVTGFLRFDALSGAPWAIAGWLAVVAALLALAYLLYVAAISRANEWGVHVKGAFDLYRRNLLKQLGYEQQPATLDEERQLWKQISRQIVFGDPVDGKPLPFKPTRPPA